MAIRHTHAAVNLRAISRAFGAAPAVSRITFRVEGGETVFVRGPNGAGKSTLLRIIATAISPTAGTGEVFGFDLLGGRDEIRQRTELVSHRTRLYEDLTALENMRFAAVIHGVNPRRALQALGEIGLAHVAGERVRGFSQGMRQRLALARAMLRAPELFLLDEPYAGLDGQAKELVDQLVLGAQRDGRTVLVVTHDATRTHLATRIVVMREGRLYSPAPAVDAEAARP